MEPNESIRKRTNFVSAKSPSNRFGHKGLDSNRSSTSRDLVGLSVSKEEEDAILHGFAQDDESADKTWSRQVVEGLLSKAGWYFPRNNHRDNPDPPSLSKAWAYYEHVTLPRHFVGEGTADTVMRRAEPGEHAEETELYRPFSTPQSSLIEWGTGIDLYFISLRIMSFVLFLAGLLSTPSIIYFASDEYSGNASQEDISAPLRGSAICTNNDWVVCTSGCEPSDWDLDKQRYATAEDGSVLILRNLCKGAELKNGIWNWSTLVFLLFAIGFLSYYLYLREIRFDEDKVTTTDYSVVVTNPPPDALDPDEWRDFFSQFAESQVTFVTIALDNEQLLRKLLSRRVFRKQLRLKLPKDTDMDDYETVKEEVDKLMKAEAEKEKSFLSRLLGCCLCPLLNMLNMFLPANVLFEKIQTLTGEIKDLQKKKYNATEIYVTFETEEGQRAALTALNVGLIDIYFNNTSKLAPSCIFQGKVLEVFEPTEPNAVRWLDLQSSMLSRIIARIITLVICCIFIALFGFLIARAREIFGPSLSGPLTSIGNSCMPFIIKISMIFERHSTEGGYQASLYLKITLARWVLSAIISRAITPFTSTLGNDPQDLLPSIYAVLFSEMWLTPLLRLLDIMGNINKHILAPRAATQEQMNLYFQGTYYNLGERYTDFTKVLFLCFFYSSVFPATFYFGCIILLVQYFVDKYCLMRIWGWTPAIGPQLAVFSRRYFFTGSVLVLVVVSSYFWAQFPYDNVCKPLDPQVGFNRTYTDVSALNGTFLGDITVTIPENVVYCSQNFREFDGLKFPATPRLQSDGGPWRTDLDEDDLRWMSSSQETLSLLYGWSSVAIVFAFVIALFGRSLYSGFLSVFVGTYEPEGDSQHIDFSSNPEIFAYVPQIKVGGFPFPFLACDVDDIDQGLIGWNDETRSYDFHNMIFDVPYAGLRRQKIIEGNTRGTATIAEHRSYDEDRMEEVKKSDNGFEVGLAEPDEVRTIYSVVKHYPTKWQLELTKKQQ